MVKAIYYKYVDNSKAILITLVVLSHILNVINPNYSIKVISLLQEGISSFLMPAFFILHGILFNDLKYRQVSFLSFVNKKINALIIPYCFFEIIGILTRIILKLTSLKQGIINLLTVRCNIGADWFLIAMFFGSILYYLVNKYCTKNQIFFLLGIIVLTIPFIKINQFMVVLCRSLLCFLFIGIGNLFKDFFLEDKNIYLYFILLNILISAYNYKFGGNDFYSATINNSFVLLLGGFSGTLFILQFSRKINNSLLEIIGKDTLVIMGTHQLVIYLITSVFAYLNTIIQGLSLIFLIPLFELIVIKILNRFFPFFIGKRG